MSVETDGGQVSGKIQIPDGFSQDFERLTVSSDPYKYNMAHRQRGLCIIINNKSFDPEIQQPERHGAEKDKENLITCFTKLGFQTKSYTNMTCRKMAKIIYSAAEDDHSDSDCFCCAILSHGDDGEVYGTDGPILLEVLFSPLKKCTSLLGKPKIFIIQACRGDDMDRGAVVQEDADLDRASHYKIPLEADFLYVYATPPGYRAWRNTQKGSYFIHYLCEVLTEYHMSRDLLWMLTHVNYRLAHEFESRGTKGEGMKQVSSFVCMLTKELLFEVKKNPGVADGMDDEY